MNAINTKPKKNKKKPGLRVPVVPLVITENGLDFRYRRGDVVVDRKAADLDQPNRTISRPMAVTAYLYLAERGSITVEQRAAAERYLELREIESGASWQNGERLGSSLPAWQRTNATETQMQAVAKLRAAHLAIGKRDRVILNQLLVENLNATAIGHRCSRIDPLTRTRKPVDYKVVIGWISAALERLVEHWGLDPVQFT